MDESVRTRLRGLPAVDELLARSDVQALEERYSRDRVVEALRDALDEERKCILAGRADAAEQDLAERVAGRAGRLVERRHSPRLCRVLNASGVVVHTNLGRSPLAPAALDRVVEVSRGYSNLEYELDSGRRGSRHDHVEELLTTLTGAEAALVVNNNAAAVLLVLAALASGREALVSRGQLVEIGGSFRIPDIMRQSGVCLVEVGTTNKTRISDYAAAVTGETALILRVHTSNFKVVGFTEEPSVGELAELARSHRIPLVDDLGSGALTDLAAFADEPRVDASLGAGAAAVTFSGDKLLGGPQAGVVVGDEPTVSRLKRHPLARALRVDKMTLAALEGTLLLYLDPERARAEIPTLRYMERAGQETFRLATRLGELLAERADAGAEVVSTTGRAGGGALPLQDLPSHAVRILPPGGAADRLAATLRRASTPVICRVADEALLLDVLTLEDEDLPAVAEGVEWAVSRVAGESGDRGGSGESGSTGDSAGAGGADA